MLNQEHRIGTLLGLMAVVLLTGCGSAEPGQGGEATAPTDTTGKANPDLEGWWCVEHGIPEGICAQCSPQLAADFQKKGDWCKEHNRPESQCFICHPALEAKFAAQYEAKFGQKPSKPTE